MTDSQQEIEQTLADVFREVLEIPIKYDISNLTMLESEKWDSLSQVLIVSAIEAQFGISFSAKDFALFTSFKAAKLILIEKLST